MTTDHISECNEFAEIKKIVISKHVCLLFFCLFYFIYCSNFFPVLEKVINFQSQLEMSHLFLISSFSGISNSVNSRTNLFDAWSAWVTYICLHKPCVTLDTIFSFCTKVTATYLRTNKTLVLDLWFSSTWSESRLIKTLL